VRRTYEAGHAIGNHTWDHPRLASLAEDQIRDELVRTSEAIADTTGRAPELFRPPFGDTDATVERVAVELGMRQVLWDVDAQDWQEPGAEAVLRRLRAAAPGAVVLLHDGGGDRSPTVAAVARYLRDVPG
jgi:peptidoglycan-N-acetylglucosamine deacetylase